METKSPTPSTLLAATQLVNQNQGDKVRFLACVEGYDEKTATLQLFHHFPRYNKFRSIVLVNIDAILSSVRQHDIEVGSWLNIVGYITSFTQVGVNEPDKPLGGSIPCATVQAIMLWSAGSINLDDYEKALSQRQEGV